MTSRFDDAEMIEMWLGSQGSALTRDCYRRDVRRLMAYVAKALSEIHLPDLQGFAERLEAQGLAPISQARTLAAVKSLMG
jgi:site-specific recombinase XerD